MFLISFTIFLSTLSGYLSTTLPSQIHIALAGSDIDGNPNSMAISWQTQENTATSQVKYGLVSGKYDQSASGTSSAYYETFHHHVVLNSLQPETTYYYIAGDPEGGFSQEFTFTSAPLSSNNVKNFTFAVFADLGLHMGDSTISYLNTIKDEIDLIWHGGDVSYVSCSLIISNTYYSTHLG